LESQTETIQPLRLLRDSLTVQQKGSIVEKVQANSPERVQDACQSKMESLLRECIVTPWSTFQESPFRNDGKYIFVGRRIASMPSKTENPDAVLECNFWQLSEMPYFVNTPPDTCTPSGTPPSFHCNPPSPCRASCGSDPLAHYPRSLPSHDSGERPMSVAGTEISEGARTPDSSPLIRTGTRLEWGIR